VDYEATFRNEGLDPSLYPTWDTDLQKYGCSRSDSNEFNTYVDSFLTTQKIEFANIHNALLAEKTENPMSRLWGMADYHFSPAGHKVCSEQLTQLIINLGEVE
jgi:hypothetical protein